MTDLAPRLADRAARGRRLRAARRWTRWWAAQPPVAALATALDLIPGAGDAAAAAALDAARPLLGDLAWAERAIAALARLAQRDPLFEPPLRAVRNEGEQGLVLIEHRLLRIAAIRLSAAALAARRAAPAGERAIGFPGKASLLRVVHAGGGAIDLWEATPAGTDFSLANAPPCRHAGRLMLADGMVLRVDGARQSWSFAAVPGDVLLVQASARTGGAPFTVEYAAGDGRALAASAADGTVSRQQLLATMLARMGRADAVPDLAAVARGDAPFGLRWEAARAVWALDPAAAGTLLRAMAGDDPHPEVRAAAAAALAA